MSWWPFGKKTEFKDIPLVYNTNVEDSKNTYDDEPQSETYDATPQTSTEVTERRLYYDESLYQANKGGQFTQKAFAASMGFGMGFFVGSTVVAASALVNPRMRQMGWTALRPHAISAGVAFGTIFAGGQLLHTWGAGGQHEH
mmetsp:Transcript_44228/g.71091  ORF Transcript_44228/g.71091 Transcript_44228/m.71091 type:complete len:142 (-) Transcript_44228:253-678(-)|eukprot:jgi/Bigna1/81099/fgenesh1_pg.77_\